VAKATNFTTTHGTNPQDPRSYKSQCDTERHETLSIPPCIIKRIIRCFKRTLRVAAQPSDQDGVRMNALLKLHRNAN